MRLSSSREPTRIYFDFIKRYTVLRAPLRLRPLLCSRRRHTNDSTRRDSRVRRESTRLDSERTRSAPLDTAYSPRLRFSASRSLLYAIARIRSAHYTTQKYITLVASRSTRHSIRGRCLRLPVPGAHLQLRLSSSAAKRSSRGTPPVRRLRLLRAARPDCLSASRPTASAVAVAAAACGRRRLIAHQPLRFFVCTPYVRFAFETKRKEAIRSETRLRALRDEFR